MDITRVAHALLLSHVRRGALVLRGRELQRRRIRASRIIHIDILSVVVGRLNVPTRAFSSLNLLGEILVVP